MSLALLQNATAMASGGLTVPFAGTGGVEPYVYSVLPGGVGGTINPTTGLYTSPSGTGIDTIQVLDDDGDIATGDILIGNALELLCDIIQTEMGLSQGRVFLWDQKIFQPKDQGLFIPISVLPCKPFGNSTQYVGGVSPPSMRAIQSVNMMAMVDIQIISRGPEARDRKEEIILALKSFYAQRQQELNSFNIGGLSTAFVNLSQIDGDAIPYRFNISVMVQYFITKTKQVPYFSNFSNPDIVVDA